MWVRLRESVWHRESYRVDAGDIYYVRKIFKTPYGTYVKYKSKLNGLMDDSSLEEVDFLGWTWFICERELFQTDQYPYEEYYRKQRKLVLLRYCKISLRFLFLFSLLSLTIFLVFQFLK